MVNEMVCPKCGDEGTISWKHDAWAYFEIIGVDDHGSLVRSTDFHTQVFDHNVIECLTCGRLFKKDEIVELLRLAEMRVVE